MGDGGEEELAGGADGDVLEPDGFGVEGVEVVEGAGWWGRGGGEGGEGGEVCEIGCYAVYHNVGMEEVL